MVQVVEGAQAWSHDGGEVGVLVLHGFTGNPVSMRPLAQAMADAGHSVELPRLPGHGTTWQDCNTTTWRDWAREAVAGFERLRSRTRAQVVTGLSMGAALALWLAQTRGDDLAGAAVVNPSIWSGNKQLKAVPVLKWVVPSLPGLGNDIALAGADEKPYARNPLKALASVVDLQRTVRRGLGAIDIPLLVLTSRQDHVVEPENSSRVMHGVSSTDKRQVWLERSYHVATLDHDAALIQSEVADFVARVTA